jgi:hypothetical protein
LLAYNEFLNMWANRKNMIEKRSKRYV